MSMTDTMETALLALLFNNTTLANMGDSTGVVGSTTNGVFYVSLHTADPTKTGNQTTNESAYTSYARVSVVRTTAGFSVSGNTVSNAGTITFPTCTGGSSVITYFGVGYGSTGTGNLQFSGALNSSLTVSNNITPAFAASALTFTAD